MTDTNRRSRTETYEHTISGLLTKRADLFNEAERIRDRLAEIRNEIDALDRVLGTLGYTGNLDAEIPRQKRQVMFGSGELTRAILDVLRDAEGPLQTRDIARAILAVNEQDARDRRLLTEVVKQCSKALRVAKGRGLLANATDSAGNMLWHISDQSRKVDVTLIEPIPSLE
jgi:hypothetical protein